MENANLSELPDHLKLVVLGDRETFSSLSGSLIVFVSPEAQDWDEVSDLDSSMKIEVEMEKILAFWLKHHPKGK